MDTQTCGPRLMSGIRKYGRYERFERFDHRSSGHASIGLKTIGKINIDCQLLFKTSQWGVLGDMKVPAGIIYLIFNFGPPQGCRVKGATVTVTLDEEATCLGPYRVGRVFHASGYPVQMTEWYGPRGLAGQKKTADIQRGSKLMPEVNVLGHGVGGMGFQSTQAFTHSARWSFNGQLLRGKKNWTYTSLRWDLNENELETQSLHNNKVQTAFTFEHSGQPFLLKVDIQGKLEKWNDRIKSKLKFSMSEKEDKIVTLVDFQDYTRFKQSLDCVAEGLPRAMEMQNLQEIPVEVADSIPGTFFQSTQDLPYTESSSQNPTPSVSKIMQSLAQPGGKTLTTAETPLLSQQEALPAGNDLENMAKMLMRELNELKAPDMYKLRGEDRSTSSSPTVVGTEGDRPGTETTKIKRLEESHGDTRVIIEGAKEEEAMKRVLELPMIVMVLRLLARLLGLLEKKPQTKEAPKDIAISLVN